MVVNIVVKVVVVKVVVVKVKELCLADMASQTQGIQQLLGAEKRAAEKVIIIITVHPRHVSSSPTCSILNIPTLTSTNHLNCHSTPHPR